MGAFLFVVAVIVIVMMIAAANKPKPKTRAEKFADGVIRLLEIAAQVAVILWSEIEDWAESKKMATGATTAELVRRQLDSGQVGVIANVLKGGATVGSNAWRAPKLDSELSRRFGTSNRIVI